MTRNRILLILLALGLAGVILVVRWLLTPSAPVAEQRLPPPVVAPPRRPLQADAEGHYAPGYPFTVNHFRFTGFNLRPDAFVTFGTSGGSEEVACAEARISAGIVHLRCEDRQLGTVTIDGKFLTRFVTDRLDVPVLSAVVTVRDGNGEVLYRARDSFEWHPGDEGRR